MRSWAVLVIATVALTLEACTNRDDKSAAREAGRTAHKIAIETEKAAKKAGQELKDAAHEAFGFSRHAPVRLDSNRDCVS